jgi:hypothetical protein
MPHVPMRTWDAGQPDLVIRLVDGPRTRLADSKIDVAFLGSPTHNNNHPMIKP